IVPHTAVVRVPGKRSSWRGCRWRQQRQSRGTAVRGAVAIANNNTVIAQIRSLHIEQRQRRIRLAGERRDTSEPLVGGWQYAEDADAEANRAPRIAGLSRGL